MMTHKYRFPAFGSFNGDEEKKTYIDTLQKNLTDSPDCFDAWRLFPAKGDILDKVTMEEDDNGKISSVTLHTYEKIYDGCEGDLRDCVADCLRATSDEHWMGRPIGATIEGDVEYLGQSDLDAKALYKYQFPASGKAADAPTFAASRLEQHLNEGCDCLGAYCMFDTDSKTLDHVSFDVDKEGNITAVNVHTYTELWEGNDSYFRDCVETNLAKVTDAIKINGDVKALGLEIPNTERDPAVSTHNKISSENVPDEGLPGDENDNGKTPAWDDGDAFAKALDTLPEEGKQMTLADYGMKI